MSVARELKKEASNDTGTGASTVLKGLISKELIFGVVGPVGSGTSWVAAALSEQLKKGHKDSEVYTIKASEVLEMWALEQGMPIDRSSSLTRATALQDIGDKIREGDTAGVSVLLMSSIQQKRDASIALLKDKAGDNKTRIYILDSLKHPAEVALLRSVYQEAFCLIGVVCENDKREARLTDRKCVDSKADLVRDFVNRDQDSGLDHGQKVADTFHLSDFFVDNTPERFIDIDGLKEENPDWDVNEQLGRLIDILSHQKIVRPSASETGMFHAYGAQMTSSCLSRQVGAALTDRFGNIVSTGTNEVPNAGGGVYGENDNFPNGFEREDHRCSVSNKYCSSNREQDDIIHDLINTIPELEKTEFQKLKKQLKSTRIGKLLEFSRAVHAEMDALLSAGRKGHSTVGGKLYVTTFPCHYCARHIVSAGIDEVQYIEPYPKSLAFKLHGDAIAQTTQEWIAPSNIIAKLSSITNTNEELAITQIKVLFKPFTGVAPRMYRLAFMKNRSLKSKTGDMEIGEPDWASGLLRVSYQEVEKRLITNSKPEQP
ncbi:anti-phage dCTP deaminase [Pseudomonas pudica]|uniref:Deoxycytidylate deaminase n=1 Tax=Pseudomonas pudica TaxID=272772 RepID=A0ABS0FZ10_9PSED|nr:anti-phage dCTP deaminase [Pseudomonas pudica]MBF8645588.1 deoxycytidylate deaminase [Pseudomonas pudica]MBF8762508.1 deoxycytidylate deaminase [Pseudomonas pudica]